MNEIEIIIVDDGSTDSSAKIISKFCQRDKRIIYIYQNNQDQGAARNKGVKNAHSDWICFVDRDDLISKYYIETLYKMAIDSKCRFAACECIEQEQQPNFNQLHNANYTVSQISEKYLCGLIIARVNVYGQHGLN